MATAGKTGLVIPTVLVIPVKDRLDMTVSIVHQLQAQPGWDACYVYDNGSAGPTRRFLETTAENDDRFTIVSTPDLNVNEMWTDGFERARREYPGTLNVGVLNNDVRLAPNALEQLAVALRSRVELVLTYPDYRAKPGHLGHLTVTQGTYRHGGMVGWCFMLAADRVTWTPLVDPQFKFWCGDDDIAFEAEAAGGQQARVDGVVVEHLGGATTVEHPEMSVSAGVDLELCLAKWGR